MNTLETMKNLTVLMQVMVFDHTDIRPYLRLVAKVIRLLVLDFYHLQTRFPFGEMYLYSITGSQREKRLG